MLRLIPNHGRAGRATDCGLALCETVDSAGPTGWPTTGRMHQLVLHPPSPLASGTTSSNHWFLLLRMPWLLATRVAKRQEVLDLATGSHPSRSGLRLQTRPTHGLPSDPTRLAAAPPWLQATTATRKKKAFRIILGANRESRIGPTQEVVSHLSDAPLKACLSIVLHSLRGVRVCLRWARSGGRQPRVARAKWCIRQVRFRSARHAFLVSTSSYGGWWSKGCWRTHH